jgi:ParB/RepB/Spo0J family partition protein
MDEISKTSIAARLAERASGAAAEPEQMGDPAANADGADDNVLRHILPDQQLLRIAVDRLAPAPEGQARQDFNAERLQALAESLKRSGVREPIIVTPHGAEPGRFQIVAGERRWRAAQIAGLKAIPCIVDPGLVERKDKLLAQAEENVHRENLNAAEEAAVLVQLMEARGIDAEEAGALLGKSQRQARRLLQLHAAAAPIKRAVARGQLDGRVALEMVRIHNRFSREDASPSGAVALKRIERLVERYVGEGWTMRKLERFAARLDAKDGARVQDGADPEGTGEQTQPPAARARKVDGRPVASEQAEAGLAASGLVMQRRGGLLVLDLERIERRALSPEERAALIELFEDLLFKTRRS